MPASASNQPTGRGRRIACIERSHRHAYEPNQRAARLVRVLLCKSQVLARTSDGVPTRVVWCDFLQPPRGGYLPDGRCDRAGSAEARTPRRERFMLTSHLRLVPTISAHPMGTSRVLSRLTFCTSNSVNNSQATKIVPSIPSTRRTLHRGSPRRRHLTTATRAAPGTLSHARHPPVRAPR